MVTQAELIKKLYRSDFSAFVRFAFRELHSNKPLCDNWHIDVMADYLARCLTGEIKRLVINVPPRSLKSLCASVALAVFALGRNPRLKIISLAGNRELASDLHQAVRRLMRSPRCRALFPHLIFNDALPEVRLPHGGSLTPGVFGRSLIGRGADIIIIDDPQSPTEAKHEPSRKAANDWYDSEALPRLTDKSAGIVIVIQQRLHREDLSGYLLNGKEEWTHLRLPVLALDDEAWALSNGVVHQRKRGELLCPARESRDQLITQLHQVGAVNFYAQYLQFPQNCGEYRTGCFTELAPPDWQPNKPLPLSFSAGCRRRHTYCTICSVWGSGLPGGASATASRWNNLKRARCYSSNGCWRKSGGTGDKTLSTRSRSDPPVAVIAEHQISIPFVG